MTRIYEIPLTPEPQRFGIVLQRKEYILTVKYNTAPEGGWCLDVERPEGPDRSGYPRELIMGLPLVTGCDLLEPFSYLEFGGELYVEGDIPARFDNLGSEVKLVFTVNDSTDSEGA